jgi:hypothetical protein
VVSISLVRVGYTGAVVAGVGDAVSVAVRLIDRDRAGRVDEWPIKEAVPVGVPWVVRAGVGGKRDSIAQGRVVIDAQSDDAAAEEGLGLDSDEPPEPVCRPPASSAMASNDPLDTGGLIASRLEL